MTKVRFLKEMGAYHVGDVAEFEDPVAREQIALGYSERVVDLVDEVHVKPEDAPAKE